MSWSALLIEHEPLAKHTSWRVGGPARFFADVTTPQELCTTLRWADERNLAVFVLGGGTNILVRDSGFPGLVLRYRARELQLEPHGDDVTVRVGAGAPMAGTARRLAREGLAGIGWAEGLPGTIGGAIFGNAGCYGGDIATTLARAWLVIDQRIVEWPVERFAYAYRTSRLKAGSQGSGVRGQDEEPQQRANAEIIIAAEFKIRRDDPAAIAEQLRQISAQRKHKTPAGSSCGSVFKNPAGDSAGRLIEAAGLKGTRIGGAEISDRHANYIVNRGGASSDDILRLIDLARERVQQAFGIELALEIQLVG